MDAKEFLKQVGKIDRTIKNKMIEVEQWKRIACGISAPTMGERVQSSGSKQKMADAVSRYIDLEADINAEIDRLVDKKREIISVIEQLPELEYDLLHRLYIQKESFWDAADAYDMSYSGVTTLHGRALKHVQKIIDERVRYD